MDNLLFTLVCICLILLSMYHLFQYDICRQKIGRVKDLLEVNKLSNQQLMSQVENKRNQYRMLRAVNLRNKSLLNNHLERIQYETRDTEREASDNLRHYSQSREVMDQMHRNMIQKGPPSKPINAFDNEGKSMCGYLSGKKNDIHQLLSSD